MTSKAVLIFAVIVAGGCRSDGGIDRVDCKQGMDFALRSLAHQTRIDAATTRATIASLPESFAKASADSLRTMHNTTQLYLDTHEAH